MSSFAHSLLGTSAAVKLDGKPSINPEVAQQILHRRSHGGNSYYRGFSIWFQDGEDNLPQDKDLVQISHGGSNNVYRCLAATAFTKPEQLEGDKANATVTAQAIMTSSNYGFGIIGPLTHAVSEIVASPLGSAALYKDLIPAVALGRRPAAPAGGWARFQGVWEMVDRRQNAAHHPDEPGYGC